METGEVTVLAAAGVMGQPQIWALPAGPPGPGPALPSAAAPWELREHRPGRPRRLRGLRGRRRGLIYIQGLGKHPGSQARH